jgi:hypothetical protein
MLIGAALLGALLPAGGKCGARAPAIQCVSNLKQIGIGFRMWANDHDEQLPMAVPRSKGGSGGVPDKEVFQHFLVASNEFNSPKILACPSDQDRKRTSTWTNFSNANLSYFVGLDAMEKAPTSILAGDRNLAGGTVINPYLMAFTNGNIAAFTEAIHKKAGNICLADGSASQCTSDGLKKAFEQANMRSMRFAIPAVDLPGGLVQTGLPVIGIWVVIGLVVLIAGFTYLRVTRAMVARAATG